MSDKSRRKLLKSIAAGSGAIVAGKSLPESWSRPVVDSVMLPAHAQTSPPTTNYYCYINSVDGWGYSVAVTGDTITFTGHDGGINLDPTGTPKLIWTGSGSTAGGSPVVISVSTDTTANPDCVLDGQGNFLNPRDITINLNGNGVPVSLEWPTGTTTYTWDLTPSATPCVLPAIATCTAPQTLFTGTSSTTEASIGSSSIFANALDSILPPASAGVETRWTLQTHLCINDIGGGKVDVDAVIELYLDAQLSESASFAAKGITADGSTQPLDIVMHGCDIKAGNFLDQFGLINDANAGGWPGDAATITVLLGQTAIGTVTLQGRAMNYAISGTACNLPDLVCDR